MHTIIIREYQPRDVHAIISLFREAVHAINIQHYSLEQVAVWAPEVVDVERWQKSLANNIAYVACIDTNIVGFIDMSHEGYLDRLYIHKDYVGGTIAYRLFKQIEQRARELGLSKITTDCSITAKKPAEFMGFVVVRENIVTRQGIELINYRMEKQL